MRNISKVFNKNTLTSRKIDLFFFQTLHSIHLNKNIQMNKITPFRARATQRIVLMLGIFALMACPLPATVVTEYFEYGSLTNNSVLAGNANGGTGWNGAWQGNTSIHYNSTNNLGSLLPSNAVYPLALTQGAGSMFSDTPNYRAIHRDLASALTGDIWFSYMFRVGGTVGAGGLLFNATTSTDETEWSILRRPTGQLEVKINGATTDLGITTINGVDYFILGRMVTGSSGRFDLWVNPNLTGVDSVASLFALQTPAYMNTSAVNPGAISSIGAAAYYNGGSGTRLFRFDALALSDGSGDPNSALGDVTGIAVVPEPSQIALLTLAALVVLVARRRFRGARACVRR